MYELRKCGFLVMIRSGAFFLALVFATTPSWAQSPGRCALEQQYDPARRPGPEGRPTEVGIGIYVIDIERVDDIAPAKNPVIASNASLGRPMNMASAQPEAIEAASNQRNDRSNARGCQCRS